MVGLRLAKLCQWPPKHSEQLLRAAMPKRVPYLHTPLSGGHIGIDCDTCSLALSLSPLSGITLLFIAVDDFRVSPDFTTGA
jgi:hypothetical protein